MFVEPQVKCIKCEEMFFSIEEMEAHLPIHCKLASKTPSSSFYKEIFFFDLSAF